MKKAAMILGSDSDLPTARKAAAVLWELDIPFETHVYSAHRTPDQARDFARGARAAGFGAVIAFARNGNPNHGAIPAWAPCTPERENTLLLDADTRVAENHDHRLMKELERHLEVIRRREKEFMGNIQH